MLAVSDNPGFAERNVMECRTAHVVGLLLMSAARVTLPHLSVLSAVKVPNLLGPFNSEVQRGEFWR
jgi:hypothetical protein